MSGLRGAIGTPDQVRAYLRRYEDCGVDHIILSCAGGRNRHEHIMESLELFAREVMPEFVDREGRRQAEKVARLAPVIDAVMARKPVDDHPALEADREASEKFHGWLDRYADRIAAGEDVSKRLS
jgi:hypothetical protein